MKIRKAVFPVAGLGTRFLPATKAMPKEMLPVVDKPLIQYAVEEALASGIEQIVFVTGSGKTSLENHFDRQYELEDTLRRKGKDDLLGARRYAWYGLILAAVMGVIGLIEGIMYLCQSDDEFIANHIHQQKAWF